MAYRVMVDACDGKKPSCEQVKTNLADANTAAECIKKSLKPLARVWVEKIEADWIIQRCTQQWKGTELQYQDWGLYGAGAMTPVSKPEMLDLLKVFQRKWPDDEFRGHNVINCKCIEHSSYRAIQVTR